MNSSKPFCIKLFGSAAVLGRDGAPLTGRPVQRHRLALAALLSLAPGGGASRDRLIGYLWPESDQERARHLLNQAVYQLRKALGEDAILSRGDELRLNAELVDVDVALFEQALARKDAASAAAIYQGPLLDGFFLSDAAEFERWLDHERGRLAGGYMKALEMLADGAEAEENFTAAVEWWSSRAAHDPYDSRVAVRLMQAMQAGGNPAGAIQHAQQHARLLQEEFGMDPPPEVAALAERLRHESAGVPAPYAEPNRAESIAGSGALSDPSLVRTTGAIPLADAGADATPGETAGVQVAAVSTPGTAPTFRLRLRYIATALAAAISGAAIFAYLARESDTQWLLEEAVPRVEEYLDRADWEAAYAITRAAEARVPGSREVADLWPRISWRVSISSQPPGATVFRQSYTGAGEEWEELGHTPLADIRIPYGLSRLRLELDGYHSVVRALGGAHINWQELRPVDPDEPLMVDQLLVGPDTYHLDTPATLPSDMVRVPGGAVAVDGGRLRLNDFFLGRHEVTNAEFKRFVDAGGYERSDLWDAIVIGGDTVAWGDAIALWVDRTGRPGPSTWEAGDYPQGEAEFPVSGVSWYEAAAYARFVGRELPTAHHWQHALANAMFPWLLPASNFSGDRPRRVTDSRAMSHVGAFDLTGNVREWTSTAIGTERIILGGSWNDPYYIAGTTDTSAPPEDRSPGNGLRLATTGDDAEVAARARAPMTARTTVSPPVEHPPVSEDVYAAYSRVFDYDRGPLNATIEAGDTTRVWIRERIWFDAGYGSERMLLHLYLPTMARPPYQAVVYWPGWDTFFLHDADEYFAKQVDFIVKSGRVVAFPIYRGTFERRVGNVRRRAEFGTAEYRDNTIYTVKDLRRTLDYLETRQDIDSEALVFFGYSWGGVNGPVAMAQETRFRAGVIKIGLLPPMSGTPEVDPVNSLPRVRVPTLMFSGEFDPMVPSENSKRYFALLGTPAADKRHVVAIGGHFVPRQLLIRETLDWLDRYVGPVRSAQHGIPRRADR